jgi:RHS repeat-associated protein
MVTTNRSGTFLRPFILIALISLTFVFHSSYAYAASLPASSPGIQKPGASAHPFAKALPSCSPLFGQSAPCPSSSQPLSASKAPSPGKTAIIKVTLLPKTASSGSKPAVAGGNLPVVPNVAGLVEGWVEVFTDCSVDTEGSYSVTTSPTHGQLQYAIVDAVADSGQLCAGDVLPFNEVYYTWTDMDNLTDVDSFSLVWTDDNTSEASDYAAYVSSLPPDEALGSSDSPDAPPGDCTCGDPIDIGTGNVSESFTDYTTVGSNILDFTRYYNSLASSSTVLGGNWSDTYTRSLDFVSATSILAERDDGQVLPFTLQGSSWKSDSDVDVSLSHSGSGTGSTWTLKDRNDTIEKYTQLNATEGLLNSIAALDGYTQTLHYNSSNQLTSVIDSFNRTLTFTYQGGLLATFTTPEGLVITYGYSSSGLTSGVNDQLASISYSDSSEQWLYTYNSFGFLLNTITATSASAGAVVYRTWGYDSAGRGVMSQNGATASPMTVAYDDTTGDRTVTNPSGQQEVYIFQTLQGIPKIVEIDRLATATVPAASEKFTYDSNGYTASQTDWNGNLTTYINNGHGLPTQIVVASGTSLAQTTKIVHDSTFVHLPDQITAPHETTNYTYDASGNMLTQTQTDTSGGSTNGQTRTWTYTYGSFGQILTTTDPRTDLVSQTTYTYSGNNVATATNALGQPTHTTSYNASGLPLSITNPNGVVTTYTYDLEDRLLSQTVHTASGNATTSFAYQTLLNTTSTPSQMILPTGHELTFQYDIAGQIIVEDDVQEQSTTTFTRDANEDITQTLIYNQADEIVKEQNATFDTLGRAIQQIDAYSDTTSYTYDANGNVLTTTDPLGHTTTQTFDALNRLTKSVDPLGHITTYSYDVQGNLTSETDPLGLKTTYTYNGFSQELTQTSPDAGTTTYTLDQDGNPVSEKDGSGIVTNRTFDALDRALTVTYPADTGENQTNTYDASSASNFGIGHLTGITDQSGTTAFTYNEQGDVLTDASTVNGKTYQTSYSYDLANEETGIIYPSGDQVSYTLNTAGQATLASYQQSGSSNTQTLVSNLTYEPSGPLTGITYGNGIASTLTYDEDYRLTGITTEGNAVVQNLALSYNQASNITAITDDLNSTRSQSFNYDADNELTQATGAYGTLAYTYGADGDMTSATTSTSKTTLTYPSTSNKLTSTAAKLTCTPTSGSTNCPTTVPPACQYTYTSNGSVASENCGTSTETLSYNNAGRNSQIQTTSTSAPGVSNSVTASYQYNALGERVLKTVGSTVTSYTYDGSGNLLAESNGSTGALNQEYVWLNGLPVAQIEANGTIYYIHTDQQGTPQKMTDSSQNVVWDRVAEPFGQTFSLTATITDNLRAPGQYFDSESSLNYNLNRSYDPTTDRYTQADPTGLNAGINLYIYAMGNPIEWSDPYGLWTFQIGYSFNVQIGIFNFQYGAGFAIDGQGNIGGYSYVGGGVGVGADAGVGISFAKSNADNICELAGPFINASVNAGAGLEGSIDAFHGTQSNGKPINGGGFTVGFGAGADASVTGTYTKITPLYKL